MFATNISTFAIDYLHTLSETCKALNAIDLATSISIDEYPAFNPVSFGMPAGFDNFNQNLINGYPELREHISRKIGKFYGYEYNPENEIIIATSANQAIFATMAAFIREGDEVILFEPANEEYLPLISLSGARPVYIPIKEAGVKEGEFFIDWGEVIRMITANTRIILINSPHNPSGMVLTELDMLRLQKLTHGTRILVICDERFENLVFDGFSHQSIAMYPKLAEKGIMIGNLTSATNLEAWNSAYCAAPSTLMEQVRKIYRLVNGVEPAPRLKPLTNNSLDGVLQKEIAEHYKKKKDYLSQLMTNETRFVPLPVAGSWFQLYNYSAISEMGDKEFAMQLLMETGVATAPYSCFFHEKQKRTLLRFNFARPYEMLEKAVEKLSSL